MWTSTQNKVNMWEGGFLKISRDIYFGQIMNFSYIFGKTNLQIKYIILIST